MRLLKSMILAISLIVGVSIAVGWGISHTGPSTGNNSSQISVEPPTVPLSYAENSPVTHINWYQRSRGYFDWSNYWQSRDWTSGLSLDERLVYLAVDKDGRVLDYSIVQHGKRCVEPDAVARRIQSENFSSPPLAPGETIWRGLINVPGCTYQESYCFLYDCPVQKPAPPHMWPYSHVQESSTKY